MLCSSPLAAGKISEHLKRELILHYWLRTQAPDDDCVAIEGMDNVKPSILARASRFFPRISEYFDPDSTSVKDHVSTLGASFGMD